MDDKRVRDKAVPDHLWMVGNELFDLSDYMDRHPGGRTFLELTRGTDCTELFETHHFDEARVGGVLSKFRVGSIPEEQAAASKNFTWQPDGFYITLRRRVHKYMKANNISAGPTTEMVAMSWMLVAFSITSMFALAQCPSMLTASVAGNAPLMYAVTPL